MKYTDFRLTAKNRDYVWGTVNCIEESGIWPFKRKMVETINIYGKLDYEGCCYAFYSLSTGEEVPYVYKLYKAYTMKEILNKLNEAQ